MTHSHQFHQIEGIVVDENITMSDLMGTLEVMSKNIWTRSKFGSVQVIFHLLSLP